MSDTAVVQGTAHIYGVDGLITGVTVNGVRYRNYPAVKAQVEDELGKVVERRRDDQTNELEIEITLRAGYTVPEADGSLFTYDDVDYEIQQAQKTKQKKNYQMVTLSVINSASVTPA